MIIIAFFNHKGGVGKTTLVYHLAWMYAKLGVPVVVADLDPQANLTTTCLDDDRLEALSSDDCSQTVYGALRPLLEGTGDVAPVHVEDITPRLCLVPGDLRLSLAEAELSSQWSECLRGKERAFLVTSSLWRILHAAAASRDASLVLIDVGSSLSSLNRAALIASSHVVVPLAPDLYSLQGLRNLGPTLRRWRSEWAERKGCGSPVEISLPGGEMRPVGYVLMQHAVRLDYPVMAYDRLIGRIPDAFRRYVMDEAPQGDTIEADYYCLSSIKHYRSLIPLAQYARKPAFLLRRADGVYGGSHYQLAKNCYSDFEALARTLAQRVGVNLPQKQEQQ